MFPGTRSATWDQRTADDLFREGLIFVILCLLLRRGIQFKCPITIIISIAMIIGHISMLGFGVDLVSPHEILIGSFVLGLTGYYRKCTLISFAGTYSLLSKYNHWCYWCTSSEVLMRELMKFIASIVVWIILYFGIYWISTKWNKTTQISSLQTIRQYTTTKNEKI